MKQFRKNSFASLSASGGNQDKFYDPDTDFWYKADLLGYEGAAEYAVSAFLNLTDISHVLYELCRFQIGQKTVTGCRSRNMVKPGEQLVSVYQLYELAKASLPPVFSGESISKAIWKYPREERVQVYLDLMWHLTSLDLTQQTANMLAIDAIVKNDDRHFRNICMIQRPDGSFRPAPLFDHGSSFLLDTYTYGDPDAKTVVGRMSQVKAKPFSPDFDEHLDAAEEAAKGQTFYVPEGTLDLSEIDKFYPPEVRKQIEAVLRESARKYTYLFDPEFSLTEERTR